MIFITDTFTVIWSSKKSLRFCEEMIILEKKYITCLAAMDKLLLGSILFFIKLLLIW
jgi:hypothetical protein